MTTIECALGFGTTNISYLSYGTIGWVKTKDNEVRQCKCLGAKWVKKEDPKYGFAKYEWKVAGMKEHQFGSASRLPIGIIYTNEQDAQRGGADGAIKIGEMKHNNNVSVHNFLMRKYGLAKDCFYMGGTWSNFLTLRTYSSNKDHTTSLRDTEFEIVVDKDGLDIIIPMLEGAVNGVRRYPTAEKAYASMKPLKVYSLDDDEDEDEPQAPKKVKVTIEVECDNMGKIKELATIIDIQK